MTSFTQALLRAVRRRWVLVTLATVALVVPTGVAVAAANGSGWSHGGGRPRASGTKSATASQTTTVAPTTTASSPGATASQTSPSASQTGTAQAGGVWRPKPGTTWQWQIVDKIPTQLENVQMYDVDLADAVPRDTTVQVPGIGSAVWPKGENAGIIERLHAAGKIAICYLDSGAFESYRPDAKLFPSGVIGNNTGWDNENWLDIRASKRNTFAPIIWARFDLARSIGCDGVEPDQNNPIENKPGFDITLADEKSWYLEVARQAHDRGLSVGMKNGIEVTDADTVAAFDWNLNEECFYFDECGKLDPFIKAGKAVFQTEYTDDWSDRGYSDPSALAKTSQFCPSARTRSFSTLVKKETPDTSFVTC